MSTNVLHPIWTFGDRVRKIRRVTHLSQDEFAARIEVGGKTLGQWESGRNEPQDIIGIAKAIGREFEVPAAWTLGLDAGNGGTPGYLALSDMSDFPLPEDSCQESDAFRPNRHVSLDYVEESCIAA